MPDRKIEWADFDAMLGDMPSELARVAAFFGFSDETGRQSRGIAAGPLMSRYSKALEYDYSAELRRELIDEATVHCRRQPSTARLPCSRSAAEKSPLLARAPGPRRRRLMYRILQILSDAEVARVPADRGLGAVRGRQDHQPAQHRQAERAAARAGRLTRRARQLLGSAMMRDSRVHGICLSGRFGAADDDPVQAGDEVRARMPMPPSSSFRERHIRSDLSCTIFLNEPKDYDGGELARCGSATPN